MTAFRFLKVELCFHLFVHSFSNLVLVPLDLLPAVVLLQLCLHLNLVLEGERVVVFVAWH